MDIPVALEQAKRELQTIFDALKESVIVVDRDFRLRRINQAALDFSGYDDYREVIGRRCYEAFYCREGVCDDCAVEAVFATGEPTAVEHSRVVDGKTYWSLARAVPHTSDGDGIATVVEIAQDVTEDRRRRQQEIRAEKVEAVARLAGAASHEINQPLGAIMGRAQLMLLTIERKDEPAAAQVTRCLQEIVTQCQRIEAIVRRMHNITDYITKPYATGVEILDIEGSSGNP